MRRLEQWERENILQSMREGFGWAVGAVVPFIVGAFVVDVLWTTSVVTLSNLLMQVKP
jgi:hypothetical protein